MVDLTTARCCVASGALHSTSGRSEAERGGSSRGLVRMMSNSEGSRSLLDYLPAALAVITGLLGAVGGLTGGIARMLRNNPGAALATLFAGVAAIILALAAQGLRRRPHWARGLVLVATA